ncbi:MAG: dihydrolipoyl dehydrogenase [Candidatus Omnitrophota bacterium]
MDKKYNIAILGAGPGGYVAAIRAAQLGLSVCLIEKDQLGGVCLNSGCIPTKALIKSAHLFESLKNSEAFGIKAQEISFDFEVSQQRKDSVVEKFRQGIDFILKKRGVDVIPGKGRITGEHTIDVDGQIVSFDSCIIATGSRPAQLSSIHFDKARGVISSDDILNLKTVPKSLLIVGGGVIGCEFAYIFNSLGSVVTIVEIADQILPSEDSEIAGVLTAQFKKKGIKVFTASSIQEVKHNFSGKVEAVLASGVNVVAEKMLLSIGRIANIDDLGLEEIGLKTQNGVISVDTHMRTNVRNFYAIGDVVGKMWLAHVASTEGKVAAENISGKPTEMKYKCVPRCIYTHPEIASVGISEGQALFEGKNVKIGRFPFIANAKAVIEGQPQGLVKLIIDSDNDELLGASLCGSMATEIIAELGMAIFLGVTSKQIAQIIHAHPTLSESLMEAAEAADGLAINIP